ncbi:MAG: PAS domain-containing sensor histidine kinase [Patescibacteria group bacterium]
MKKNLLLVEHLSISTVVLVILFGLIFSSFSLIQNVWTDPQRYFSSELSVSETQFYVVYMALVLISVFVSYIIYLLLTLRTRAEIMVLDKTKSLLISLDQFTKLYEGAPVPYIILNKKGEIVESNKAALRFFGVVEKEIIDKNIFSFQPKEDSEKADKFLQYYKSNIPINKEEIRMITKSGEVKWVMLSVFEMKDLKDPTHTGLATIFDITERKQLDQAKTEFVSLASHQLRTPVSTVKWYTDMLRSGSLGELQPKQTEYIDTIYKVNEGMIDLIDLLLNISRTEIGTLKMDIKAANVIDITDNILVELSSQIQEKNININKQYNNKLKNIKSDPKLLRIVIQNLLSNAVKYAPQGGEVGIIFKDSLIEKTISVSDNGIGIPKGEQFKIFTKLFRASNTHDSQGTGLGLYLVKSIMKTIGGDISFISEENKGTTFTIKL